MGQKEERFKRFGLKAFGLRCHSDPVQPTTQQRPCVELPVANQCVRGRAASVLFSQLRRNEEKVGYADAETKEGTLFRHEDCTRNTSTKPTSFGVGPNGPPPVTLGEAPPPRRRLGVPESSIRGPRTLANAGPDARTGSRVSRRPARVPSSGSQLELSSALGLALPWCFSALDPLLAKAKTVRTAAVRQLHAPVLSFFCACS